MDRAVQFALAASRSARNDAGLHRGDFNPLRAAVFAGTARGATGLLEAGIGEHVRAPGKPPRPTTSPLTSAGIFATAIAHEAGFQGTALTVSATCASAAHAIGLALDALRAGRADLALAGGAEAPLTPFCLRIFDAVGVLSASGMMRPFDRRRDGFLAGEGAGFLLLETEVHARRRGARVLAELAGYGASCEGGRLAGMPEDGGALADAIRAALSDARLEPGGIGYVSAHGTATRVNDRAEAAALMRALGAAAARTPISSTKPVTGHMVGATAALEAIVAAETCRSGLIPPTPGLEEIDPDCRLDHVLGSPREAAVPAALSLSMGFGGNNACLVLKPC